MNRKRTLILARRRLRRLLRPTPKSRLITLHLGAHKTGSTYIQATLEQNRHRLPLSVEYVPRNDPDLAALAHLVRAVRNDEDAEQNFQSFAHHASRLATRYHRVEHLIISHEDLLGALPTRHGVTGLYPFAALMLPHIIAALGSGGAKVTPVIYLRNFNDWKRSLYRYKHQNNPDRAFNSAKFAERFALPANWLDFKGRLASAIPGDQLKILSYERDRETGLLGRALYQAAGLSDTDIAGFHRVEPKNVSRTETALDHHFEK